MIRDVWETCARTLTWKGTSSIRVFSSDVLLGMLADSRCCHRCSSAVENDVCLATALAVSCAWTFLEENTLCWAVTPCLWADAISLPAPFLPPRARMPHFVSSERDACSHRLRSQASPPSVQWQGPGFRGCRAYCCA